MESPIRLNAIDERKEEDEARHTHGRVKQTYTGAAAASSSHPLVLEEEDDSALNQMLREEEAKINSPPTFDDVPTQQTIPYKLAGTKRSYEAIHAAAAHAETAGSSSRNVPIIGSQQNPPMASLSSDFDRPAPPSIFATALSTSMSAFTPVAPSSSSIATAVAPRSHDSSDAIDLTDDEPVPAEVMRRQLSAYYDDSDEDEDYSDMDEEDDSEGNDSDDDQEESDGYSHLPFDVRGDRPPKRRRRDDQSPYMAQVVGYSSGMPAPVPSTRAARAWNFPHVCPHIAQQLQRSSMMQDAQNTPWMLAPYNGAPASSQLAVGMNPPTAFPLTMPMPYSLPFASNSVQSSPSPAAAAASWSISAQADPASSSLSSSSSPPPQWLSARVTSSDLPSSFLIQYGTRRLYPAPGHPRHVWHDSPVAVRLVWKESVNRFHEPGVNVEGDDVGFAGFEATEEGGVYHRYDAASQQREHVLRIAPDPAVQRRRSQRRFLSEAQSPMVQPEQRRNDGGPAAAGSSSTTASPNYTDETRSTLHAMQEQVTQNMRRLAELQREVMNLSSPQMTPSAAPSMNPIAVGGGGAAAAAGAWQPSAAFASVAWNPQSAASSYSHVHSSAVHEFDPLPSYPGAAAAASSSADYPGADSRRSRHHGHRSGPDDDSHLHHHFHHHARAVALEDARTAGRLEASSSSRAVFDPRQVAYDFYGGGRMVSSLAASGMMESVSHQQLAHRALDQLREQMELLERLRAIAKPPGLTKSELERLPTSIISEAEAKRGDECCICLETFVVSDQIRRLPCLHINHTACIDSWLARSTLCPTCRMSCR